MAKKKLQVTFLVSLLFMVLKNSSEHNCTKGAEEKQRRIAVSGKILKINQKYEKYSSGRNYQLDMNLPRSRSNAGATDAEGAVRDRSLLWPEGIIPYVISYHVGKHKKRVKAIEAAMKEWEHQTCIRFEKATREANYVEIEEGKGCSSDVGMIGGRQTISLGKGCYSNGIILHELGHAIGFYHEQNRPDRDDYVEILEDNVKTGYMHAFNKYEWKKIDSRSVPYDYESIMHYGAKDFSRNRSPTIRSLDPAFKEFGNNHLSPLDIKQAHMMYNCSARNPRFPKDFTWSNNGRTVDAECVRIFEPREPRSTGWRDNFICQTKGRRSIDFRWSPYGPLADMRCTKINLPSKRAQLSWNNNYLCVPHASIFKMHWSTNGPLANMSCLKITEPRDRVWSRANPHLCAYVASIDGKWSQWEPWDKCSRECGGGIQERRRTCTDPPPSNGGRYCAGESSEARVCNTQPCSAWPRFPDDFTFGAFRVPPRDKSCIRLYERFQYTFNYPYFCSDGSRRELDMRWSDMRPYPDMRCTRIYLPRKFSWNDNYLCIGMDAPYRFKWSYKGAIQGLPCMKFVAKRPVRGWESNSNFLCLENQQVITDKDRISRVDGRWSPWQPWAKCSKSCNGGWQSRIRTCTNPSPRNGGKTCEGLRSDVRLCNTQQCPPDCGGMQTGNQGVLQSPSYPKQYPPNSKCTWTIKVARGQVVKLTFNSFKLHQGGRRGCDADSVTIKDGLSSRSSSLGTFCGSLLVPRTLVSKSNTVTVRFKSDSRGSAKGFQASWKAETFFGDVDAATPYKGCGGKLTGNEGTFMGSVPPGKTYCNWFITADKDRFLTVVYEDFDVTKSRGRRCRYNYVELREYFRNGRKVSRGRQCGTKNEVTTRFRLKTDVARIRLRSLVANKGRGIKVRWSSRLQNTLAHKPR